MPVTDEQLRRLIEAHDNDECGGGCTHAAAFRELLARRAADPPDDGHSCADCFNATDPDACCGCPRFPREEMEDHWSQATERQLASRARMREEIERASAPPTDESPESGNGAYCACCRIWTPRRLVRECPDCRNEVCEDCLPDGAPVCRDCGEKVPPDAQEAPQAAPDAPGGGE